MKKSKMRCFAVILTAAMTGCFLAGCGGTPSGTQKTEGQTEAAQERVTDAKSDASEKVELFFYLIKITYLQELWGQSWRSMSRSVQERFICMSQQRLRFPHMHRIIIHFPYRMCIQTAIR